MQAAARSVATSNNAGVDPNHRGQLLPTVSNGLAAGGLVPDSGLATSGVANAVTSWQNANTPTQTTSNGRTVVNIVQTAQQAVLNWTTFNIGRNTTLNFDQSAGGANVGQWIAFNKITDPSGSPSQILGSMTAPGQVYVINQNGIIFGGASQVSAHALVASSLPINDNLINRGLLNNPDAQFLFSALSLPAGANGTPAFNPSAALTPTGVSGDVTVQAGAQITSPTTADHVGGRVALVGPNVTNNGTISTPDGQTILAAGLQVGFAAHSSNDPGLRGLDVYVGAVDPAYSGVATNTGLIDAPRADLWMTGMNVNQLGVINSTTSVSLNGRIDLLADYNAVSSGGVVNVLPFLSLSSGALTLGPGSVTQILPEWSSSDKVVGSQLSLASQVNLQGLSIHLAGDATLFAPGASVALNAGAWNYLVSGGTPGDTFVFTNGQIYLDSGATIDVAGSTDVSAAVSENFISAQLLGTELANSPLQRNGLLRGKTVQVDIRQNGTYNGQTWIGTPVADVSGYAALVQRTVGELTTSGGTVNLTAGGSVVMQNGASIDVSGGWINYQAGMVQTTKLISNGHAYDISQATPDLLYTGIASAAHFEAGYIQGGNGGAISITAPSMALDGGLYGNTVAGSYQRQNTGGTITASSGTVLPNPNALPSCGALTLAFQSQALDSTGVLQVSPTPPSIMIQNGLSQAAADAVALDSSGNPAGLRADRVALLVLSPDLVGNDGFGILKINNSDGNITIPVSAELTGRAGGSISLLAANLDIEGRVTMPGGSFSASVYNISPYTTDLISTPPANSGRGNFTLGGSGLISVAGLTVDDRSGPTTAGTMRLVTAGGAVTIKSYNVNLVSGGIIDANGGVLIGTTGKLSPGAGGSIAISAGQDLNIAAVTCGRLTLGAVLEAFSGTKGGSLSLQAPLIQVGDSTGPVDPADTLLLEPEFFNQGGFGSFALTGLGDPANQSIPAIYIAPDTKINAAQQNLLPSIAANGSLAWSLVTLPDGVRTPVNLTFNATGVRDIFSSNPLVVRGDFVMAAGSLIRTDPSGSVSINGDTVSVLGSIIVPGGNITIKGGNNSFSLQLGNSTVAVPTVDIGPDSLLSVAGETVLKPDSTGNGYRTGSVLSGGNLVISGNIIAEAGSVFDVSGASGILDLATSYSELNASSSGRIPGTQVTQTRVDSNGGSIILTGGQELFVDATLLGRAGGQSATGGSLTVSSGLYSAGGAGQTPLDPTLLVTQTGAAFVTNSYLAGQTAIGKTVLDSLGNPLASHGYFTANQFNTGGFGALTLKGVVEFSGPVTITVAGSLTIADGGVVLADPSVNTSINLNAPYVALGKTFQAPVAAGQAVYPFMMGSDPYYFQPTYGTATLNVHATQLIDLGNLSLQNIGTANFTATGGDIRGDGTVDVQGSILLTAGQIYPPTAVSFTIAAYDYALGSQTHDGSVTIAASGSRQLPLSAGGELNIYASEITQGGVLRAPIGTINLGWNGVGTSPLDSIAGTTIAVTPTRQLTLAAGSITSVSAVDPLTGKELTIPYGINSNGTAWIDPTGTDITTGGVPAKSIRISAQSITDQAGSTIDISGGGDLYAYRWVSGAGGTQDILASTSSFAVIPGYQAGCAPYAPNNSQSLTGYLGSDPGYVNGNLAVGEQIYLGASSGLPAGIYTLLPAKYALLPGAFLVTPKAGQPPNGTVAVADGSRLVTGYLFNGLDASRTGRPLLATFEVASQSVVLNRAEYDSSLANTFLQQSAQSAGVTAPRLPVDSGALVFAATRAMTIQGALTSRAPAGGLGGLVDISSPVDILIAGGNTTTAGFAGLVLQSAGLSAFGADSLLIGGVRSLGDGAETISVTTNNIIVDNAGAPLTGPDIILAAKQTLKLETGAAVEQSGVADGINGALLVGSSTLAGSGDGVLLRVSGNAAAQLTRSGVDSSGAPSMSIGAGVVISGASVTLDSTHATSLDPAAKLSAGTLNLASGQISLQLTNPGELQSTTGLVLSSGALQTLQTAATSLSLLSYTSIDVYGTGQVGAPAFSSLALQAAEVRGFNNGGGTVSFDASNITLGNLPGNSGPGVVAAAAGTLAFNAGTIRLGVNRMNIDQFSNVQLNAGGGVLAQNTGGLAIQGELSITTPLITGATGVSQTISAGGALRIQSPPNATATVTGGLGASLTLIGDGITVDSNIVLPSGNLTLHATAGDLVIGNAAASRLDVSGIAESFFDLVKCTSGGGINLIADSGNINVASGSSLTVAAPAGGGSAGSLSVSLPAGTLTMAGSIRGTAGAGGQGGSLVLDIGSLASVAQLNAILNAGGFTLSRSIRVRTGDVLIDGVASTQTFNLSSDQGAITVAGTIDASGLTGGTINLEACGSITLQNNSLLTVAAKNFNDAGKGGAVTLEAGCDTNGKINSAAAIDLQAGSTIDLSVAAGSSGGTLHLRAPRVAGNTDLQIGPVNGSILGASSIVIEGYKTYNLTATGGLINASVESAIFNDATAFAGAAGSTTTGYAAMVARLFANNTGLESVSNIEAGAEIINTAGDLILSQNWSLSSYRFGPNSAPGVLTLRAAGDLVFSYNTSTHAGASLSDGFTTSSVNPSGSALWTSLLMPAGSRSWSFRLVAGADFTAADFRKVQPLSSLGSSSGSFLLGLNCPALPTGAVNNSRSSIIPSYYQTIRTGTGDIDIYAGRNVEFLNPLATIYTAGSQAAALANFDTPKLTYSGGILGAAQSPIYAAQYSLGGGNVTIVAQNDIVNELLSNGQLVADSSKEMPTNWLYRRGWIDPATGQFGITRTGGEVESTSWWIDFSNFFEDVGTLGGGNITLIAGHDISNVDAVVPTNARMPKGTPDASKLIELGGGDLAVTAGHDINGGVYYVERGQGKLSAGGSIHTNSTRAALNLTESASGQALDSTTWLPTTLFLGKGSFDISAVGDVLLGPVANPFLLPQGINNSYLEKIYFSTYAAGDRVDVASLAGAVTIKDDANGGSGSLQAWYQNILLSYQNPQSLAAQFEPWLRLVETSVNPFTTATALMPATLAATAFSGNINLIGSLTLSPSPVGTVDLAAAGSVNGVQPNFLDTGNGSYEWGAATINLSDANPGSIPGVATPLSYSVSSNASSWLVTGGGIFDSFNLLFDESGSTLGTYGVLQTRQALHAPGILHANDSTPVHIYATGGDISGLTLFSGKFSRLIAARDITDIALYIQNDNAGNVSLVSAGRDIIAYDPNSILRGTARSAGNEILSSAGWGMSQAGDIQISGPGTLEVLAGRNLNLGVGSENADGTGVGVTSIGNARNPYLPFGGADVLAGAGIGNSTGLSGSKLDFAAFIAGFLNPATGGSEPARYLADLGSLMGLTGATGTEIWNAFGGLSPEQQDSLALDVFYLVLRDSGRDHNNPASPGYLNYNSGFAAIAALFPGDKWSGDISLTSREIKTISGGNISLFAPGGKLTVGLPVNNQPVDQGILTQDGGAISIFTKESVIVGTSRIFTLRGGDEIIWSSAGDIAAGASSKTVQSAPPTRVLIDPQSGDVQTDLAGLATGGGIGVLETVAGIAAGDVDLIAPVGTINAGDAGIRVSGNLNISALHVLNAGNIQVGGASVGASVGAVSGPSIAGMTAASNTAGATTNAAVQSSKSGAGDSGRDEVPSIITVEVLGFGGDDSPDDELHRKKTSS